MQDAYARAGVDVDANNRTTAWIKQRLARQTTAGMLSDIGGFSGLWALNGYRNPVLAASTDSVGTKIKVAIALGRYETIGRDIVHHCVDDILVSGASPLFFLDYLAVHRNVATTVRAIIGGVASACEAGNFALLGGETAEMPDLYREGDFDLAGTIIGVAERDDLIHTGQVMVGDVLLGLPSTGLHTNGYSLARRLIPEQDWEKYAPELACTYGEALLWPHRSYQAEVARLRATITVHGLAHITGGGLTDNVPRILPPGMQAVLDAAAVPMPPLFVELVRRGALTDDEALRTFNLGVGMVAAVEQDDVARAQACLPEAFVLGRVAPEDDGRQLTYSGQLRR